MLEKTRLALALDKAELNTNLGAEAAALGRAAGCVVNAALVAAARMQAALLTPQALSMQQGALSCIHAPVCAVGERGSQGRASQGCHAGSHASLSCLLEAECIRAAQHHGLSKRQR